jgi:glycosyltransferase involved in cell wall biosynthesis
LVAAAGRSDNFSDGADGGAAAGRKMKSVAIVCDWLTEGIGGAERVIKAVHDMYPNAPIYTSQYRPDRTAWLGAAEVRTGWLNYFPVCLRRFLPVLRAHYFSHLDLSDYDVVISITGAEAKYVRTGGRAQHICYLHAPTQYYWGKYEHYIADPGFGVLNPLVRVALRLLVGPLRRADYEFAQKPDVLVANSSFVQAEIKQYYRRDSVVIFPPVSVVKITTKVKPKNQLVVISRLANWKRVDLSIGAVKQTGDKLLVMGAGPARAGLMKLASGQRNIRFKPAINSAKKIAQILTSSKGFIFASQEPFGIAPVEALMLGVPVIAYRDGGALDFIADGVNGVFFDEQTVESLAAALDRFRDIRFNPAVIKRSAAKFSENNFKKQLKKLVET